MFRVSSFHKLLDKATSNLRLEPDWPTVIQICDLIRQGDVNPKYALAAIKKKVTNPNPHVALFGLLVLESCVKNCGYLIHDEVGTKGYMEQLREIIRSNPHEDVKNKILELIQAWAHAFRNSSKYRAVQDTLNIMKTEGYKFPVLKESDAMFSADTAPEWADGDCCHRCRVAFGVVQRKHHCRACGQVFCAQCSSKTCMLPKYGIEKEVRVCDPCYDKHTKQFNSPITEKKPSRSTDPKKRSAKTDRSRRQALIARRSKSTSSVKSEDFPTETVNSTAQPQKPNCQPGKSDEELREEEELQLALALSQSEAESAKKNIYRPVTRAQSFSPPVKLLSNDYEKEDPELARYLNRSFWENKSDMKENISQQTNKDNNLNLDTYHQHDPFTYEIEYDNFTEMLRSQVEIFVNRMKSNSSRGRPISTDSSIQTLFLNLTAMHSRLLHYIQEQDDQRVYYEMLQDKINQVKDARAALDALREEHKERLRREAEMAERQRQLQMAQKLEIMRQKKQEYLQYQRQLALKRVHDQEMELHMRQEQQKQQYRLGPYNSLPYIPSQQGGMSAFDPVTGMGMNSLPNGTNLPSNSYISPQHIPSATYGHYAQVPAPAPAPPQGPPNAIPTHHQSMQPQGMQPPPTVGQTHAPTTLYMPVAPHPSQEQMLPLGHMQPPQPPQSTTQSSQLPSQAQKIHGHPIYQMVPPQPSGATGGPPPPSLEQEYAGSQAQPILPPSQQQVGPNVMTNRQYQHSPLSSPSSSSEHSVIRQGPPPIPSAPSASSTPQPVEKEDVVELISFD